MKDILVSYLQSDVTGCSYYRLVQVRNELNNRGYIKCYDAPHNYSPLSDIVIWQRYDALEILYNFDDTKINIYELDDNLWALPDYLGSTKDYFIQRLDDISDFINKCDYVTTTTDYLADEISKHTGFPRDKIITIPNYLNTKILFIGKTSQDGKVRIAWTMDTRRKDFDIIPVEKTLHKLLKEYPDKLEITFFGDVPKSFIKEKNVRIVPFNKNIEEYYMSLMIHPIDIGICPAQDTIFNNSKSNLKAIEYGAIGIPVVASPISPYNGIKDMIRIAKTPKDWYNHLKELIETKYLRIEEGLAFHDYVVKEYDLIDVGLKRHMELYKELIAKKNVKTDSIKYSLDKIDKKILYCVSSKSKETIHLIKRNVSLFSGFYNIQVLLAENKGAYGLDQVYNQMVKDNPDYDYYIFAHDDIQIFDEDWISKIINGLEKYDIVGIAGGRFFDPMHGMWAPSLSPIFSSGAVAHATEGNKFVFTNYGLEKEVLTIDGCLIAMKSITAKKLQWKAYNKFHFYDIAFCLDAHKFGYKLGVVPIGIKHKSMGNYNTNWGKALHDFRNDYGTKPYRLNNEKILFNVYTLCDDREAHNHMLTSLDRQSVIVNYKQYNGEKNNPYLILDRSIHFYHHSFEILNNLVKLDKYGKIEFNIADKLYTLHISDNKRKYIVRQPLGLDYLEEYSYDGKY